jgi:hypothetical protein
MLEALCARVGQEEFRAMHFRLALRALGYVQQYLPQFER